MNELLLLVCRCGHTPHRRTNSALMHVRQAYKTRYTDSLHTLI